jgi:predicted phage-related endonuclease
MSRIAFCLIVVSLSCPLVAAEATPPTAASSQPATTQPANEYEKLAEQTVSILDRATAVIGPIKDEASAKEAVPNLETLKKEIDDMKAAVPKLGQPTDEQQAAMMSKYAKTLETSYLKLVAEETRVMKDPALAAIVGKPLMSLGLVKAATTTTAP